MFSALLSFLSANVLLFILHIDGSSSFPKPLSAKEERAVLERLQDGDPAARATLIERNLRLVSHIVKKYYSRTNDTEDLVSIGTIGLIKGISTLRPMTVKLMSPGRRPSPHRLSVGTHESTTTSKTKIQIIHRISAFPFSSSCLQRPAVAP